MSLIERNVQSAGNDVKRRPQAETERVSSER
jgi:hypothetical protein